MDYGIARRIENSSEIISMTSGSWKTIVAKAFAISFKLDVMTFFVSYRYYLIGHTWNFFSDYIFYICFIFFLQIVIFYIIVYLLFN